MKHRLNKIWINIKLYAGLPHFWISGLIIILSIISFTISVIYYDNNPFVSSVFANIFAGLVTGIVISLISTIKSITLYRTECLIEWLDLLHKEILVYIGMYQKMMFWNHSNRDEEAFYNHIYDTLSYGNNINVTISQGRFNSSIVQFVLKIMKY